MPYPDDTVHKELDKVYERCASGCTCDGSLSIVAAYYGIQDVTYKVAQMYHDGERYFLAASKIFGKGGYDEEYAYTTLTITYQQFCKYVTIAVPNFALKKTAKDIAFYPTHHDYEEYHKVVKAEAPHYTHHGDW